MGQDQGGIGGSDAGDELLGEASVSVQGEPMTALLTNKAFKYTPGGNVDATWRKYGYRPPTEYRNDYLFKTNRENQSEQQGNS